MEPSLFKTVDVFEGVKDGGILVQATAKDVKDLSIPKLIKKVGLCNAFHIALEVFGRSITNTIMLGALLKTTHVVSLDSLSQALEEVAFRDAALGKNVEAVHRGYEETQVYDLGR